MISRSPARFPISVETFQVENNILAVIYRISTKISKFRGRFPGDFQEISRFHENFQDFNGDFRQGVRDFRKWRTPRSFVEWIFDLSNDTSMIR